MIGRQDVRHNDTQVDERGKVTYRKQRNGDKEVRAEREREMGRGEGECCSGCQDTLQKFIMHRLSS